MKTQHRSRVSRLLLPTLTLLALGLSASAAQTLPGVKISSPKPHATISGTVPVVAVTNGISAFSYATLSVDVHGKNLTNANPLRFDLDTTRLANGPHSLQVAVSDDAGILAVSSAVPVFVMNAAFGTQNLPAPTNSLPENVPMSATKPVTPFAKAAPPTTKQTATAPVQPVVPTVPAATLQIAAMSTPAITRVIQRPIFAPVNKSTTNMITTILLDGKPLGFGCAPIVEDGRTMIFLRPLITAIGGAIRWDGQAKQATATLDQHNVVFTVGQNTAIVDGQQTIIDRKVVELNGHLVIPATAWHDLFAGAVGYDEEYSCVWLRSHASLVKAKLAK